MRVPTRGSPLEHTGKKKGKGKLRGKAAAEASRIARPRSILQFMSDCSCAQLAGLPGDIFALWVPSPKKQNWKSLVVQIRPKTDGCPWKDCAYRFKLRFPWKNPPHAYPNAPPSVTMIKDYSIYHPNFALADGRCRVLESVWPSMRRSEKRIVKACWALHDVLVQPELADTALVLNPVAANQYLDHPAAFNATVRAGLVGERIPLRLRGKGKKKIILREFQFTTIASMKTRARRGGSFKWQLIHGGTS